MINSSTGSNLTNASLDTTTRSYSLNMGTLDIAYVTVTCIVSLMSILGCLVLLVVHWVHSDLRTVGRSMLVHLTVADLLTALGNLMGVSWYLNVETMNHKMVYCKFHSALTIMSSIASFMWTVVIAWFVFWIMFRRQPSDQKQKNCSSKVLPVVCWGIPVIIALVALLENVLGYDKSLSQASWCWIDPTTDYPLLWMLVTGKAWEVAACASTVCLYMAVKVILFKQAKKQKRTLSHHNRKMDEANTKLTFVPLVFIVLRIWGTIRFLLGIFAHDYASSSDADWIVIMQGLITAFAGVVINQIKGHHAYRCIDHISPGYARSGAYLSATLQGTGDSAQGFANCVIYCFFTNKIRQRILQSCHCSLFSRPQSVTKNSRSSQRFSKKRPEMSTGHAPSRRYSNRVVPVFAGTEEDKDALKLKFGREQVVNNQPTHHELAEESCQQQGEEQPLNASQLQLSQAVQQSSALPALKHNQQPQETSMHGNIHENSPEHNQINLILQNESDTTNNTSPGTKQADVNLGCVDSKVITSLELNNCPLWTTEVSQSQTLWNINLDIQESKGI